MVFAVRRLPEEAIVIVTISVPVERYVDNFRSLDAQIAHTATEIGGQFYCLWDLRGVDLSFSDILLWSETQQDRHPGSLNDPLVHPVLIGNHPLLPAAVRRFKTLLNLDVPLVATLDEALALARAALSPGSDPDSDTAE